jgi:NodT family efflux transporter outer membrane factor (OMF) lipoprotein
MMRGLSLASVSGVLIGLLSSCTAGPDYARPNAIVPSVFKEQEVKDKSAKGWKRITPLDLVDRGPWWMIYRDPELSKLVSQVEISNQTVAAAEASYQQAREIIREGQAGLFPTVTAGYTAERTRSPGNGSTSNSSSSLNASAIYASSHTVTTNASWELDVWGRIRRTVEADAASAQLSAADLANAELSAQTQLAIAYFNLRASDELEAVLQQTLVDFRRTRDIVKNQYTVGTSTRADFITADTQVLSTEAIAINVGIQRAQYEHAIAVLTGRGPAELSMPKHRWTTHSPPVIPVGIPSRLLERRPDIAAAERQLQQLNALVGVAVANFYPVISLSGVLSFAGPKPWPISAATEAWALIGAASQPMFDGGALDAQLQAAKASYLQGVANYRQTVLTAFQQVEDQLAAIRLLTLELKRWDDAVKEAREAVTFYLNQYRVGTVAFTSVVTAQSTLLTNIESALTVRQNLFVASVNLIAAIGGGWEASNLPAIEDLSDIKALPLPVPVSALPATFTTSETQ